MDQNLTPKDMITKVDGEAMLKAVAGAQAPVPASGLLGPDGQPVATAAVDMEKAHKARVDALHDQLKKLTQTDATMMHLCASIMAAYRLIAWARMEIYSRTETSDEFIEFVDRYFRATVYTGKPFTIKTLLKDMKHEVLPFVDKLRRETEAQQNKRLQTVKPAIGRLRKFGGSLPLPAPLAGLFEKGFRPGQLLVVHGGREAVQRALGEIGSGIHTSKITPVGLLTTLTESERAPAWAELTMTLSWWAHKGSSMAKLMEVLQPVSDSNTLALVVEDLALLEPAETTAVFRGQKALGKLYQWALENYVAVVIGDDVSARVFDPSFYTQIPNVAVSVLPDGTLAYGRKDRAHGVE